MSAALVATGWWMAIDVPNTPNAVVICVIIFNAAFGYRSVPKLTALSSISDVLCSDLFEAGDLFHGYILPRYFPLLASNFAFVVNEDC